MNMNRNELNNLTFNEMKCKELKKKLKPILHWTDVYEGTRIFHEDDRNIFNDNRFIKYEADSNLVKYRAIRFENKDYYLSATGWYYYDESIADKIEEHYTPKLYKLNEEGLLIVAFDKEQALKDFKIKYQNYYLDTYTIDNIKQIKEIDGFHIKLN